MNLMALAKIHDLNKGMSEGLKYITSQNASQASIKTFFEKKINFLGFHDVVLVKTFLLMY